MKKRKDLTEKEKMYIQRAYSSTERLIKLVNDMLNVSRIESGRLKLEIEDFQITDLFTRVITELTPRAKQLGLKLTLTKPLSQIKLVHADPARLEQVIINLIGNSFKFTPAEGFVNVSLIPRDKDILVQIQDSGKGMTGEVLQSLFQKFATSGSFLHKDESQSTGLGLYISKSLIELQGGKIWAESRGKNKGSTFSFNLNYANNNQTAVGGGVGPSLPSASSEGTESADEGTGVSGAGGNGEAGPAGVPLGATGGVGAGVPSLTSSK